MKIFKYTDLAATTLDTDSIKSVKAAVAIGKADGASNFCMRIFTIEKGGYTPRHSHAWEHGIFIHQGRGQVFNQGSWIDVESDSVIFISGNEKHQIRNTGDSPLVFVCVIPSGPPEL
ncbi:MAG: cupin domain-containing protein [Deltaproteobacteria bacterium]|nr:cupin domain-containing protein [Deltaproteobacteria bacterium]